MFLRIELQIDCGLPREYAYYPFSESAIRIRLEKRWEQKRGAWGLC